MNCIITTAVKPDTTLEQTARAIAGQLPALFVARAGQSLEQLKTSHQTDVIIAVTKKGLVAHTANGDFFFHPSMAQLRIKNLISGKDDHMVSAMNLTAGMSVLDCTLGLGTDAIVASYVTGPCGQVTGLEAAKIISLITDSGLKHYQTDGIDAALRRINVVHADYHHYLAGLPEKSFDIVYFDPMFRRPIDSSSNIKPLRQLADNRALTPAALRQAVRVARKRVVIKETRHSGVFAELGIKHTTGGKYSSIHYGMIEAGGEECSD